MYYIFPNLILFFFSPKKRVLLHAVAVFFGISWICMKIPFNVIKIRFYVNIPWKKCLYLILWYILNIIMAKRMNFDVNPDVIKFALSILTPKILVWGFFSYSKSNRWAITEMQKLNNFITSSFQWSKIIGCIQGIGLIK